jgi:hypothetical protein
MGHVATVGTAVSTATASSFSIILSAAVPVGRTVTCVVACESSAGAIPTVSSVTDTRGNTWTTTPDVSAGGGGNVTVALLVLRARITTALQVGDVVTVSVSSGTRTRWLGQLDSFDDVNTSPLDKTQHADNPTASASLSTGTTASPTAQAYELVVAAFAYGGTHASPSPPSGWSGTAQLTAGTTTIRNLMVIWKYTSATGTQQGTLTIDASAAYAAVVATYKATNASPPTAQVSQVRLTVPNPTAAGVAQVSQVKLTTPQAATGVAQVSQVVLRAPTLPDQAPYSGLKAITADGKLINGTISPL